MKYNLLLFLLAILGTATAQQTNLAIVSVDTLPAENQKVLLPFGELEQYRVVGAVDIIKGDDLIRSTEYNVESALAGLVPGLSIFKGQQSPGIDQTFMRIRGNSRGGQSEFPLVVIDGIANRSLSSITLEEIESIQVLKDVTAKMLYGSRAANGVLMVTTKRGYDGPKKVTVSGEYGIKTPTRLPEYVNSAQYAQLYNQARLNDGLDPLYTPDDIEGYRSPSILFPDVDFYNEFLEPNTNFQRINAQLIGGTNNTQYFLNVGYVGENGLERVGRQQQFNRINVRSNLDYKVNSVVSMFLDIAGRLDIWDRPDDNQGLFGALSTHRPNDYPLYVSQTPDLDSLGWSPRLGTNLVGELARSGYRNTRNSYAQTNVGLNFDLNKYVKGFSAGTFLTFDVYNSISIGKSLDYSRINPSDFTRIGTDVLKSSEARMGDDFIQNLGLVSNIDYDNSWNNHDLSVSLVSVTQTLSRKATLAGPTTQQDDKNVNIGLRANYVLSNKYVVEASSSYMGSDKFTPENRWGLFGAGGLGWIISQEGFLKNSTAINYLKLKGTYGVMGYDRSFDYLLYRDFFQSSGNFRTGERNAVQEFGWRAGQIGNPNLTFEKSRELNLGIEGRLFNNKISFEANYFDELRYDIPVVLNNALPDYTGELKPIGNFNEVSTQGVDAYISYSGARGDFAYSIGANIMYSKSIHEVFDEINPFDHLNRTGQPTDALFGWEADGLYLDEAAIAADGVTSAYGDIVPGDIRLIDFINDGVIDQFDLQIIGNTTPRLNYALNLNLSYKGLELFVVGQGVSGFNRILGNSYYWNTGENKYSVQALNAAVPGNVQGATYPRLTSLTQSHSYRGSTYWMVNGAYFKLRTLELSYALPQSFTQKIAADNLRVFARGTDLFAISEIEDLDPENINTGVSVYPMYTTISFGLKLFY